MLVRSRRGTCSTGNARSTSSMRCQIRRCPGRPDARSGELNDRRRVPVRRDVRFSSPYSPFPLPLRLPCAKSQKTDRAGQYFFSFILISICNNQSDFRGMKMQCGHIRKNDVFALNDPEQSAGKCAETSVAGRPSWRGFRDFAIVDEKAPYGKTREVNNSGERRMRIYRNHQYFMRRDLQCRPLFVWEHYSCQ